MKSFRSVLFLFLAFALGCTTLSAQSNDQPPVTRVFATLTAAIDSKIAVKGDEITLQTLNDITVGTVVIIPKGTKIMGYLANVINKDKQEPKTFLAIAIDRAILKNGDIHLQGIIAAIAAPQTPLPDDPTYAMMHSNEPKMVGSRTSSASSSGTLQPSSKANSNAAVATAEFKGASESGLLLREDSQGAIGYENVEISWNLSIPPPLTIIATKAKSLKLLANTQVLLRMVPPQILR